MLAVTAVTDWEESIWRVSGVMLSEWRSEKKRERSADKKGHSNKMWLISKTAGIWGKIQRGESFKDNLKEYESGTIWLLAGLRIELLAGVRIDAVVLARESAVSLPEIPVWSGTQRSWISKPVLERVRRRFLINKIRELGDELKTLEGRDCRQDCKRVNR